MAKYAWELDNEQVSGLLR